MARSGKQWPGLRQLRTEVFFSGESLRINARALFFGLVVGLLVGVIGGAFARLLDMATLVREGTPWAIWLMPLAGLPVVWMYTKGGIRTAGGTDVIIQAARGEQPVSRVLAPVIFASTLLTHFFGGSAGREGAALQLGGSLAELVRKRLRIGDEFEDLAIMCGMSAGFSAVFGNQISAVIFALEISCVGMLPMGALFPCVVASITAGHVARAMGVRAVTFII
ncbi:MAG: chloride channel protein, partial [Ruminiclostridium sp.]|nr:chloride channel protein [Ruminiclostridium sp.]